MAPDHSRPFLAGYGLLSRNAVRTGAYVAVSEMLQAALSDWQGHHSQDHDDHVSTWNIEAPLQQAKVGVDCLHFGLALIDLNRES